MTGSSCFLGHFFLDGGGIFRASILFRLLHSVRRYPLVSDIDQRDSKPLFFHCQIFTLLTRLKIDFPYPFTQTLSPRCSWLGGTPFVGLCAFLGFWVLWFFFWGGFFFFQGCELPLTLGASCICSRVVRTILFFPSVQ